MVKWFKSLFYIFMLLTIAICSNIATASDRSSDDDTALEALGSKIEQGKEWLVHQVKRVLIYSHANCEECDIIKAKLKKHNIEYQDVDLTWNRKQNGILSRKAKKEDVSYVFIGNEYIGNHKDLEKLTESGKLLHMLEGAEE
jgi:glutaredoxin